MTIDVSTADALDALAVQIMAATAPDPNLDAQLYSLIAEPMQTLQGRTAPVGYHYTLNVTNALLLRAKGWYLRGLLEIGQPNAPFASCGFEHIVNQNVVGGANAQGATIGLATAAAVARCWALIIRESLGLAP